MKAKALEWLVIGCAGTGGFIGVLGVAGYIILGKPALYTAYCTPNPMALSAAVAIALLSFATLGLAVTIKTRNR
jgi:hypothetical protein